MLSFIKNYFWNIASTVLIIIIAESIFFYNKIPAAQQYKKFQELEIKLNCKIDNLYLHLRLDFCLPFLTDIQEVIRPYILSSYSLDDEKTPTVGKIVGNILFYRVNFDITLDGKIIKINEKDFEKLILTNAENYFQISKVLKINDYLHLQKRIRRHNNMSNPVNLNSKNIQSFIQEIEDIKTNDIINVYFKYSKYEEKIKNKLGRLNYFNVLLVSLIFGIYINIIAIVLLQNNLLKK